jgi:hypothetical protein
MRLVEIPRSHYPYSLSCNRGGILASADFALELKSQIWDYPRIDQGSDNSSPSQRNPSLLSGGSEKGFRKGNPRIAEGDQT